MGNTTNDIQDINLSAIRRKRFRIDGDDNKIIELNTSDFNMIDRLAKSQTKITDLQNTFKNNDIDENNINTISDFMTSIDKQMRDIVDYIFDSNVSEICAPDGTMFDVINGKFRYEYIIEILAGLYEKNLKSESAKIQKAVEKHTAKYTKK